jgi:hypothetical protein
MVVGIAVAEGVQPRAQDHHLTHPRGHRTLQRILREAIPHDQIRHEPIRNPGHELGHRFVQVATHHPRGQRIIEDPRRCTGLIARPDRCRHDGRSARSTNFHVALHFSLPIT